MTDWVLIIALAGLCTVIMAHGLARPGRYYEFPFLAAATFASFILPQLFGLANDRYLPAGAFEKTVVFSMLCLLMCWAGWRPGGKPSALLNWTFSERRLLLAAAILSLIGAFFFFKLSRLPDEERLRTIHTGTAVMYLFFAKLLTYGFAIAVLCYFRRPSLPALLIILFDSIFIFDRIVIAGRRGEAAEYVLIVALALWFQRRWAAPRLAVLAAIVAGFIAMPVAEEYRNAMYYTSDPDWSAIVDIDIAANVENLLSEGGSEMRNAIHAIDRTDRLQRFDFGISHWNWLVFNYVPAQVVGRNFKESLLIDSSEPVFDPGYEPTVGSTSTGMADAFGSFWYFGALKFLLIAFLISRIYSSGTNGNTTMQLLYMLSVTPAIHCITHYTQWIFSAWIHIAAFMMPALFLARLQMPASRQSTGAWPIFRAGRSAQAQ